MITNLKPYPAYKDSGVPWLGKVPKHWEVRRFKYVLQESDVRSVDGTEQLLRVSQYTGVTERRRTDGQDGPDTRAETLVGYKRVEPGELVVNIMLAWNGSMGISPVSGIASPAYCVYRFGPGRQPLYFHHLLRSPAYKARIKAVSTGVVESRLRLYTDDLYRLESLLPPLSEQSAIGRFLDYVDRRIRRYIRAKKKLIALLNEQKQAIIHRAVTRGLDPDVRLKPSGVEWLGEVPEHWEIRKLGQIARVLNGTTPSRVQTTKYWQNGTIPWLSSGKVNDYIVREPAELITNTALAECALSVIPRGSVILGMIGQGKTRGMSALLDIDACINQNLAAIVPGSSLDGRFLHHLLTAFYKEVREGGRGGNQEALNCEIVSSLRLPIPTLSDQIRIVDYLARMLPNLLRAEETTQRQISLIREYRTSLVADVVTGKLDVREAAARLPDEAFEPEVSIEEALVEETDETVELAAEAE